MKQVACLHLFVGWLPPQMNTCLWDSYVGNQAIIAN
jgi:hypothetical protein